jgi:hypothetical protein
MEDLLSFQKQDFLNWRGVFVVLYINMCITVGRAQSSCIIIKFVLLKTIHDKAITACFKRIYGKGICSNQPRQDLLGWPQSNLSYLKFFFALCFLELKRSRVIMSRLSDAVSLARNIVV